MLASRMNIVTLREDPAEAEIASHRLLTRAGYLYKSGAGLYLYGPLLQRVLDKVQRIVADEISSTGALQVTMPILQEQGLWERSGRWATYQASRTMLTVKDRGDQVFGLAPTAEEVVTDYAAAVVQSYKQLPVTFFQQHTKFRDEIRPRFGLMRVKEFVMMDAYSFHASEESLDQTYQAMRAAYTRAFRRMGLEAFAVEADSGAIGGSGSHEFMVAADVGEDTILFCKSCGYAANVERAVGKPASITPSHSQGSGASPQKVRTPISGTIQDVVRYLNGVENMQVESKDIVKTLIYDIWLKDGLGGRYTIAAFVPGDRELNEVKLFNSASRMLAKRGMREALSVSIADGAHMNNFTKGFIGPGPDLHVSFYFADSSLRDRGPMVVGANEKDHHLVNFVFSRDSVDSDGAPREFIWDDLVSVQTGDECLSCKGILEARRGIEVGHVFKLGTKYSAAMEAVFTGEDGKRHPFIMGCYGIGSSRVVAAAVEQHHDEHGITWPLSIAPYHAVVVPVGKADDQAVRGAAEGLYAELKAAGIEVVLDDRDLKPGVKFKDWDLLGIPWRIVCGRGVAEGKVEVKARRAVAEDQPLAGAAQRLVERIRADLGGAQAVAAG